MFARQLPCQPNIFIFVYSLLSSDEISTLLILTGSFNLIVEDFLMLLMSPKPFSYNYTSRRLDIFIVVCYRDLDKEEIPLPYYGSGK